MPTSIVCLLLLLFMSNTGFSQPNILPYQNPDLPFEHRAHDLVSRMTIQEKVSQLVHDAKAVERLGVPAYNWMNEALHGVANMEGAATVFPQSIGMAASFDPELMYKVASAISDEARAMHHSGVRNIEEGFICGLDFWSPDINLYRDPRWGRGQETYGEDPFLTGKMAVAFIKGMQGNHPKYLKTIATVKHYVVHSGPEALRHEFNTISRKRDFWETYMPHFISSIREANVQSVMCAYSRLNGESCCGSDYLLNELLRERFGFEGYIVSDCGSVSDIFDEHHLTNSFMEAAVLALKSGVDLNCGRAMTFPYDELTEAVHKGLVEEALIDTAAYRLMLARFKLGMFDPPDMVPFARIAADEIDSDEHKSLALQMARESIVLLRNEGGLLPLSKNIKKIAVIGPNAADHEVLFGNYHGTPSKPVSVYEGIRQKLPAAQVLYSRGSELIENEDFAQPVPGMFLSTPDGRMGLRALFFPNRTFSGQPLHERIDTRLEMYDEFGAPFDDLEIDNFSVRWQGFITFPETAVYKLEMRAAPHFRLYIGDKLVADEKKGAEFVQFEKDRRYKIQIDFVSDEEGFYCQLLHKADNASLLRNAKTIALQSDAVILVMGISSLLEEESMDRERIELPAAQQTLIKEITKQGKPTILVVLGGGAIAFDEQALSIPAVVEAWYPGQSGGTAVADVLFGDYNPAGRLPVTFYKSTEQLPPFEDYSMDNRTYKFFKGQPLYPFGFGLSYSRFEYSNLRIADEFAPADTVRLSVEVKNTGKLPGDEVVQVYVQDVEASVRVPLRSLQAFKRIHLAAGDMKMVEFNLPPKALALLNDEMDWMVEPGAFIISVGGGQPGGYAESTGMVQKTIHLTGNKYFINNN